MFRDSWIVGLGCFEREVCSVSKALSMLVRRESHVILVFCPFRVYNVRMRALILLKVFRNSLRVPMICRLSYSFPARYSLIMRYSFCRVSISP